jgi:hypothetical protein
MKPFLPTCLPTLILALVCTAQAQGPTLFTTPFYPLKVGHQWTYRSGKETVVIRVDKEVRIDIARDEKGVPVGITRDDKSAKDQRIGFNLKITSGPREATEQVAVLDDGVYRFHTGGRATKPPLRFFTFKVQPGDSWPVACKTDEGKAIRGSFVVGTDTIELMLNGKKEKLVTVTITSKDYHVDDMEASLKYWFARDYGMVKQQTRAGKYETTLELEEFKAAK